MYIIKHPTQSAIEIKNGENAVPYDDILLTSLVFTFTGSLLYSFSVSTFLTSFLVESNFSFNSFLEDVTLVSNVVNPFDRVVAPVDNVLIPEFIFFEFTDNVLIPVFNVFTPAVIWFDPCCSLSIPVVNSSILVGNTFRLFVF